MKCNHCPLYHFWSNESGRGEDCDIFGDAWDSPLQYEDKIGNIVGCYVDRHYINKVAESDYQDWYSDEIHTDDYW